MTTQRRVGTLPKSRGAVRPEVDTRTFLLRALWGVAVPVLILFAITLPALRGDVFIEQGRQLGPFNLHHLTGLGCALFGLSGVLLALGVALKGWTIGCESDECRDMGHLGLILGAPATLLLAALADAVLRGG